MPDIATPNWGFSDVIPITSSVSAVLGFPWGVRRIFREFRSTNKIARQ